MNEANRQNWLGNIPKHFDNITRNTGVCIKHFGEKDVHTVRLTYIDILMYQHYIMVGYVIQLCADLST